jgi:hypothetical protein
MARLPVFADAHTPAHSDPAHTEKSFPVAAMPLPGPVSELRRGARQPQTPVAETALFAGAASLIEKQTREIAGLKAENADLKRRIETLMNCGQAA